MNIEVRFFKLPCSFLANSFIKQKVSNRIISKNKKREKGVKGMIKMTKISLFFYIKCEQIFGY